MASIGAHDTRFLPRLESLETREVPAVQIFMADHVLHVLGDGHSNVIVVRDNGQGTITVDAGSNHFTAGGILCWVCLVFGGADRVSYQLTGALKTTEDIHVMLGKGADRAHFDFSDGIASGGHLKLTVDGGRGADHESVRIGSVAKGGSAVLDLNGGKGNDTLTLYASGWVAGRLSVTINGGPGHNTEDIVNHEMIVGTGSVVVKSH